jgi:hypothetical protein
MLHRWRGDAKSTWRSMLADPALPPRASSPHAAACRLSPHGLSPPRSPPQPERSLRSTAGRGRPVSPTRSSPRGAPWPPARGSPLTLPRGSGRAEQLLPTATSDGAHLQLLVPGERKIDWERRLGTEWVTGGWGGEQVKEIRMMSWLCGEARRFAAWRVCGGVWFLLLASDVLVRAFLIVISSWLLFFVVTIVGGYYWHWYLLVLELLFLPIQGFGVHCSFENIHLIANKFSMHFGACVQIFLSLYFAYGIILPSIFGLSFFVSLL